MAWIAQLPAAIMRKGLVTVLTSLPLFIAACAGGEDGPTPYDDDYGITSGNINEGAPDNDSLPDDKRPTHSIPINSSCRRQSSPW